MSTLRIYLFGGLRVYHADTSLPPFPTRKTRSLFACLVTYRQRSHPRPVLAGTFWGDMPDARAHRNLNTTLWRLRRILPPGYLTIETDAIAFNTAADYWLDAAAFEAHCSRFLAGQEQPGPALEQALSLYRGDFLAGLYEDWCLDEVERLRSLYLQTLQALLQHHKKRKEYQAALEHGLRLLATDPLRERVHQEVMELYYRLGQRSAALAQFETCRRLLYDELGIAPMPQTVALYEHIRSVALSSSVLTAAPPRPPPAPLSIRPSLVELPRTPFDDFGQVPLVGRQSEIAQLLGHVGTACQGRGGMVLIEGEAGVGKSRLVQEVVPLVEQRGALVLRGACHELGEPPPYQGLTAALRTGLARLRPQELSRHIPLVWLSQIALLLPELQVLLPELPSPPLLSPQQARGCLLEALAQYVTGLSQLAPCILIIEDLHWADQATLEALCYLLPHLKAARVLLVGTIRPEELAANQALQEAVRCLEGSGALERLTLGRLTQGETRQLVQQVLGLPTLAPLFSKRIYQETEGNPFFVAEVLKALYEEGLLYQDKAGQWSTLWDEEALDYAQLPLPQGIRQAVQRRLARLSKESRSTLDLAAVLGREFDFDLLLKASGRDEEELLEASDDLLRRQLLVEIDDGLRFSHDKIRQVAYDELSRPRRRWLHRQAGLALEAMAPQQVEELARHFYHGEMRAKALTYSLAAGDRARSLYANRDAIAHYRRALRLLEEDAATHQALAGTTKPGDPPVPGQKANHNHSSHSQFRKGEVLMSLGHIHHLLAQKEEALTAFRQALTIWAQQEDHDRAAAAHYAIAQCYFRAGCLDEALHHAQRGLACVRAQDLEQAMIKGYRMIARCHFSRGDLEAMKDALATAMELAHTTGDRYGLAECHRLLGDLCTLRGDHRQALEHDLQAARLLEQIDGHDDRRARLYNNIAWRYLLLGKPQKATHYVQQGLNLARRIGAVIAEGWLRSTASEIHIYLGRWQEARRELASGLELARRIDNRRMQAVLIYDLGLVAQAEGKNREAVEHLEHALTLAREVAPHHIAQWTVALAEAYLDQGELQRAQEQVEHGLALAKQLDNQPVIGLAHRIQGRIRRVQDRWQQAAQAFDESLAIYRKPEDRLEIARTLHEYGRTLLAAGDRERGQAMLLEALQIFVSLGAKADEDRVRNSVGRRQIRFRLAACNAPLGRPLHEDEQVSVLWTVDAGPEDEALRQCEGKVALRRSRLLRLLSEAESQGGLPTEADLAQALNVSERTIRSDIAALRLADHCIRTRGSKRTDSPAAQHSNPQRQG